MDSMGKQTYQCAQYKLKIVYKRLEQKESEKHALLHQIIFWVSML